MQAALHLRATVRPGGRVEIIDPQLPQGERVDVIVLLPERRAQARHSIADVLASAPGHLSFRSGDEVDAHLKEAREEWER